MMASTVKVVALIQPLGSESKRSVSLTHINGRMSSLSPE